LADVGYVALVHDSTMTRTSLSFLLRQHQSGRLVGAVAKGFADQDRWSSN
jgi:hypothetical protein